MPHRNAHLSDLIALEAVIQCRSPEENEFSKNKNVEKKKVETFRLGLKQSISCDSCRFSLHICNETSDSVAKQSFATSFHVDLSILIPLIDYIMRSIAKRTNFKL